MSQLLDALLDAIDWCEAHHTTAYRSLIPPALKTVEYYRRVLWADVREFYNGMVDRTYFEGDMLRLIDEQLTRAWNEGAREVGVEPGEMTEDDLAVLEEIKLSELDAVPGFADAIEAAREAGTGYEQFRQRVELWVNRYPDVVNRAMVHFGKRTKLVWRYGDTDHCDVCAALNNIVAFAEEWEQSGLHPQQPENPLLTCGGWNCACSLEVTDRRRSPKAFETLMDIAAGHFV